MNRTIQLGVSLLLPLLLAACGGGDEAAPRGALLESPTTLATLSVAQIDAGTAASGLQPIAGRARCDVKVVALNYATLGVRGERFDAAGQPVNASGVLLLPGGAACSGPVPLVAYAKGTDVQKPRTLANPADGETFLLAAVYAAQGYAVVASDYLGYAKSVYTYHPYLHADSEASAVIDAIRAARNAAPGLGTTLSGKVMLTGYSQGGHASMAAHRAAERDNAAEINVVAGAHLAGPYNLAGAFKLADPSSPILGIQFFVPFMITSWQKVYGDAYARVGDVFKAPYDATIESLLPSPTLTFTTLLTTGALPAGTPKQAQDALFQSAFLADTRTNDNNGVYRAALKNTLFGWSPKARVLLCGGAGDPTVPPLLHQAPMKADFDSRALANVSSVDVDAQIQATFGPGGVAPTDPTSAAFATYYGSYHGSYEPPFCHASARALFDALK